MWYRLYQLIVNDILHHLGLAGLILDSSAICTGPCSSAVCAACRRYPARGQELINAEVAVIGREQHILQALPALVLFRVMLTNTESQIDSPAASSAAYSPWYWRRSSSHRCSTWLRLPTCSDAVCSNARQTHAGARLRSSNSSASCSICKARRCASHYL